MKKSGHDVVKFAFLTCVEYPRLTDDDRLVSEVLSRTGHTVTPVIWTRRHEDWQSYDRIVFRSTWDYVRHAAIFEKFLQRLKTVSTKILNPLDVISWNLRKTYLEKVKNTLPSSKHYG